MKILAIDPGTHESAYVLMDEGQVKTSAIVPNAAMKDFLGDFQSCPQMFDSIAIEMVACYGMAVGKEVFETCLWIGRFMERSNPAANLVYRKDVKLHHCGSVKAKDANIRQAILDRFGGKDKAIGKKANPGPLYGIKSHIWAALAIALYVSDRPTR